MNVTINNQSHNTTMPQYTPKHAIDVMDDPADERKAPAVVSEVTSVAIPASRNTSAMKLPSTSASLPFDERLRQELRAHLWAGACRLLIDK